MKAMTQNGEDLENGDSTKMDMKEFDLMRTRLRSYGLVDENRMIDIKQLAMTFLGVVDEEEASIDKN